MRTRICVHKRGEGKKDGTTYLESYLFQVHFPAKIDALDRSNLLEKYCINFPITTHYLFILHILSSGEQTNFMVRLLEFRIDSPSRKPPTLTTETYVDDSFQVQTVECNVEAEMDELDRRVDRVTPSALVLVSERLEESSLSRVDTGVGEFAFPGKDSD